MIIVVNKTLAVGNKAERKSRALTGFDVEAFFRLLRSNRLSLKKNCCNDHSSLSSTTAVQI